MFNRVYYTIKQSFKHVKQNRKFQYKNKRLCHTSFNNPNDPDNDEPDWWIIALLCGGLYCYNKRPPNPF